MSIKKWLIANVLFKVLDILTTIFIVVNFGFDMESNPIVLWMMLVLGMTPGLIVIGLLHTLAMSILYLFDQKLLLKIATVITALIPITNLATIIIEIIGKVP